MKKLWGTIQLRLLITFYKVLQLISPKYAASRAYRLMSTPRTFKRKKFEVQALEKATVSDYRFKNFLTKRYQWGTKTVAGGASKTVLLIHGWEGHAGNFGAIVDMLVEQGCTVFAFDAPSHGASDRASTTMFEFGDFVGKALQDIQPDYVITHSFGSVAIVYALVQNPHVTLEKLVMITTPDRFEDRINQFFELFGFSAQTRSHLYALVKAETGQDMSSLSISAQSQQTDVAQALIIHDRDDKVIPLEWARHVADTWPVAELIEIEGTGHYRILWDEQTERLVTEYLFP